MANTITLQHDWAKLTIDNYENTPLHTTKCFLIALEYFNALDRSHILERALRATHHFYECGNPFFGSLTSDYGSHAGDLVLGFHCEDYKNLTNQYARMVRQIPLPTCWPTPIPEEYSNLPTETDTHRLYLSSCKTAALYVFYDASMQISRAMLLPWDATEVTDAFNTALSTPITTQSEIDKALALDWSPLAYQIETSSMIVRLYQAIFVNSHKGETELCAAYLDIILASVFTRMTTVLAGINHQMKLPPKLSSIVPDPSGLGVQLVRTKV